MTLPLDVMRTLAGTQWSSGPATGRVREWVEFLAATYPDRANYVRQAESDYLAWCGLTVAYTVARCGISPPKEFLLAMNWANWGTDHTANPQRGDIAVFAWSSGGHHVTEIDEVSSSSFKCFGGNQSHQVNDEPFPRSSVVAVRSPPLASVVVPPLPGPSLVSPSASNFNVDVELVLVSEGGNDDDPRDPGGRTSRGILQREWDTWRQTHPGLPSDVWQAPQSEILAIYKANYWDVLLCDQLPAGLDYSVFDFGVNSGVERSARLLQSIVGVEQDGEVGPLTVSAAATAATLTTINRFNDERLSFLESLSTWPTFHNGWTSRVSRVRADSISMAGKGKASPSVEAPLRPLAPPPLMTAKTHPFDRLFGGDWQSGLNQMFGGKQ